MALSDFDIVMFPESLIQLNREIEHHPKLMELLANHPMNELEVKLAEVAAYVEVILDGDYGPKDVDGLCTTLRERLYTKRTGVLIVH
jgi:hypothetical protein